MPRPPEHSRVALVGTLPNGEIFSTGFWTGGHNITTAGEANAYAAALAGAWQATAGPNMAAYLSTGAAYQELQVYHYAGTTGPASVVGTANLATPGTGPSSNELPIQCAIVVTLETGFAGRRNRGRMYFPLTNADLSDHQLTQDVIDNITLSVSQFFNAVNGFPDFGPVRVVSQVVGASSVVSSISCDSEVDIQRRRANRQTELRQASQPVT